MNMKPVQAGCRSLGQVTMLHSSPARIPQPDGQHLSAPKTRLKDYTQSQLLRSSIGSHAVRLAVAAVTSVS